MTDSTKLCRTCGEVKALDDFAIHRRNKTDGRQSKCRECDRAYYLANHERILARGRDYSAANRDRIVAYMRVYNASIRDRRKEYLRANRDRLRAQRREYHMANREKILASQREYRQSRPEVFRQGMARRRARKRNNGSYLVTERDIARLLARHNFSCAYCSTALIGKYHLDHVVPISRGGGHSVGNLFPACVTCNKAKSASTLTEWYKRRKAQP